MSTIEVPTTVRSPSRAIIHRWLLACGVVAGVLYTVVQDAVGLMLYAGYSPLSQNVSELTSLGAPSRLAIQVVGLLSDAFVVAFAVGVWQSARGQRRLRVVAGLLFAFGCLGPLWLPFPMTARGDMTDTTTFTDAMHIALAAATVVLILTTVAVGAFTRGPWFRVYSLLTLAVVLVAGMATFGYAPTLAAGEPTPWMGVLERVNIGAWYLWLAVLAITLLRAEPRTDEQTHRSPA